MKKIYVLFLLLVIYSTAHTSVPATELPAIDANQFMLPVGSTGKTISLMQLATIGVKEFETITNKKLGFFNKLAFKLGQKKLRNKIEKDGTIKPDAFKKSPVPSDGETGFHLGGVSLGFFTGFVGVIISYLIRDDNKPNRVKWAWLGFVAWLASYVVMLMVV